tara:strand:- start:331 stop:870 length:540 start_codon:yes stop_codon:yes gene_type:complete
MPILKIAKFGHPVLIKKAKIIKNLPDISIENLAKNMIETMLDADGLGLAGPQVHINKQIIVFRVPQIEKTEEKNQTIEITVLINPKLTKISKETENDWEGCLSIPRMSGLVKRFAKIEYEGLDMKGNIIKREAEGLHARIVQHEYDHLMGVLYLNRLADPRAFGFTEEIEKHWKQKNEE